MNTKIRCEVCGRVRPERQITVVSVEAVVLAVPVQRNVNHCWDDIDCADKARAKAQEFVARMAEL